MRTQIIYDNQGHVLSIRKGEPAPREPIGVPFLWVEIPKGKQIKITDGIGVDVNVNPHRAILEDVPPSEIDGLNTRLASQEQAIAELTTFLTNL